MISKFEKLLSHRNVPFSIRMTCMEVIEFMSVVTIIGYRSVSSVFFNDRLVSFELFMQLILII